MCSLNCAAEVIPLGQLHHQWLTWEGNMAFPIMDRDHLVPMPGVASLQLDGARLLNIAGFDEVMEGVCGDRCLLPR